MPAAKLISKYNVPGPRYTSYPTVPYWNSEQFSVNRWKESVKRSYSESKQEGISLYIHLPFARACALFAAVPSALHEITW